ncbi:cytochrome oxidase assembly protein ShyY1 [Streptacidiphilus sp. EB129]
MRTHSHHGPRLSYGRTWISLAVLAIVMVVVLTVIGH